MSNNIKIKPTLHNEDIVVDLRYLKMSKHCLGKASWVFRDKKNHDLFFKDFQSFIYDFCEYEDITKAVSEYTSRINGSRKDLLNNGFVKNMLKHFSKDIVDHAQNELVHVHLKRKGKGKAVIFGSIYGQSLIILGIDPEHRFSK